jgi:hypothetical protein
VNNPISDAAAGLLRNAGGLVSGKNPLFAPQGTSLFGFNLPAVPLISARDYFLTQMESWVTSIPLRTQWIVLIDRYPAALNTKILQSLEYTGGDKKGWDISTPVSILKSYPLQRIIGCLFASSVTIPPETLDTEIVNIKNNRGFIGGLIAAERQKYGSPLRIGFRETNTSFVDNIIRPWIILASHFGFTARPGDRNGQRDYFNVKTDVTLLQFANSYQNISMIPRKVWTFYNCVPTTLSEEEVVYDPSGEVLDVFQTSWFFSHYTTHSGLYFPLVNIIDRIQNGQIPQISPIQGGTGGFGSINPFGFI